MRTIGVGLITLALLGSAGCSASSEAEAETSDTAGTVTQQPQGGEAAAFSIRGSIESLPRPSDASYPIAVGDLAAGAQALGLEAPETAEEKQDWARALGVATPDSAVTLMLPRDLATVLSMEEEPELGFELTRVSSWAEIGFGPDAQVLTGDFDDDTLSPDLIDVGDGVRSAGEGEDLFSDLTQRTPLRPLGQPLRVGQDGDQIVLSSSTQTVANWLSRQGPALAEDAALLDTADQLDALGAVSGYFLVGPSGGAGIESMAGPSASPEEVEQRRATMEQELITQPFGVIAVGTVLEGTSAQDVVVYHFGSESVAAEALEQVERVWADGHLLSGAPIAEWFTVDQARADGATVVVLLDRAEARSDALTRMLVSRETPLTHL